MTLRVVEPDPVETAAQALSDVERECELDTWGHDDLWAPPNVWQAILAPTADDRHRVLVAVRDGADEPSPAGVAHLHLPVSANQHLAHLRVLVRPGSRHRGVGSELIAAAERVLADEGREVVISYVASSPEPPAGPGALEPPTGTGRVPADTSSTRFALGHGFELEQVCRQSVLTVPDDLSAVVAAREAALAVAGDDYRLHVWHDEIPRMWWPGMADLMGRFMTDAPTADLAYDDVPWDTARVERWLATYADRHQHLTVTAAEHVPTGILAGFTELMYPVPEVPFAFQNETLVRADHRGRRLGMAVKAQNLVAVRERRPGLRRVHTDNAEENAHMLAINVALGFAPAGVRAALQKKL